MTHGRNFRPVSEFDVPPSDVPPADVPATVMVHVSGSATSDRRPAIAGALAIVGLAAVGLGLITPVGAADDGIKEARQKREDARNAQLQAARQINLLTAEDTEVAKALADIEAAVLSQQMLVEDGRRRLSDAQAQLVARESDLTTATHELEVANAKVQGILIARYVGESDAPMLVLRSADAQEALRKEAALDFLHGSQSDAVNAYQAARTTLSRAVDGAAGSPAPPGRRLGRPTASAAPSRPSSPSCSRDWHRRCWRAASSSAAWRPGGPIRISSSKTRSC